MILTDQEKINRWFEERYAAKGVRSMRKAEAYPIFLDYLNVQPGKKLLDIGCGPGLLLKVGAARGLQTYGIDVSEEAKRLATQISPDSQVSVADVRNLDFEDQSFDYITCIGVLEHFLDLEISIKEMQRVAKKQALYCIMVPNSKTLYWWLAKRLSRNHKDSNENAYTLSEWWSIFELYNFEILAVYRDEWQIRKPFSLLGLQSYDFLFELTRNLIWKIIPLNYAHQFVFIMRKKNSS